MTHEYIVDEDGLVTVGFIGEVDEQAARDWQRDISAIMDTLTGSQKVSVLVDASREGKMSGAGLPVAFSQKLMGMLVLVKWQSITLIALVESWPPSL